MSTCMIRDCIDEVLPLLVEIANLSLILGEIPMYVKLGIITALLKKCNVGTVLPKWYTNHN